MKQEIEMKTNYIESKDTIASAMTSSFLVTNLN